MLDLISESTVELAAKKSIEMDSNMHILIIFIIHLMDIYLTRPSRAVVSPHCPTQELLAKILGIWHVSLRPPGLHPETPSGGAGGLMASSLLGPHIADSPYCVDPSPAGASLKETPHPKHL